MIAQQGTLEISRSRLRHNLQLLKQRAGRARLCATIKADAYGHGMQLIADLLREENLEWACVYALSEALELARVSPFKLLVLAPLVLREPAPGMIRHIVSLGGVPDGPREAERMAAREEAATGAAKEGGGVRFNVTDAHTARTLSESVEASAAGIRWPVHVQVDAGLTRNGVAPSELAALVSLIQTLPGLRLEGVFAHFSHGDVPGHDTVAAQLAALRTAAEPVKQSHPDLLVHMQNSGGALHLGDAGLDMVRVGIALYGMQPSTDEPIPGLLPIARVLAPILVMHDRPAGVGVGYGHTFVTRRPSRIAVVPVGYADGYPRQLSNRGVAQVRGRDVPVVGRVSMDQIILDLTDLPEAAAIRPGEPVTVIAWVAQQPNCLDNMADAAGTIGYELATHLGARLQRVVVD